MTFLSSEAAKYNMATGLKNAGDIINDVLPMVQFSIIESCAVYDECAIYAPFVKAAKPVFRIEYPDGAPGNVAISKVMRLCTTAGSAGMSLAIKSQSLDGWVQYCDVTTATTSSE